MGVAKAALEATTRYLANDLGPDGIRVNAISPGPMKTLAGAAIGGARKTFKHTEINSPLRSNASLEAVGGTAVYLASEAGAYTTGEIIYVDGGYHIRTKNRELGWVLTNDGPKTLNGFITEHLENIPEANVCLQIDEYRIEILSIKDNVIRRAKLSRQIKSPGITNPI